MRKLAPVLLQPCFTSFSSPKLAGTMNLKLKPKAIEALALRLAYITTGLLSIDRDMGHPPHANVRANAIHTGMLSNDDNPKVHASNPPISTGSTSTSF